MASTGFTHVMELTNNGIDAGVVETAPGAYVLGHTLDNGNFSIRYVGRSDDDLNGRLKDHVGKYKQFKGGYMNSASEAFQKECHLYHDFGGAEGKLDNEVHPARPSGSRETCPVCGA